MITLVAPKFGFFGGVEKHVFDLAQGLRARGHRISLVYQQASGTDQDDYAAAFDETARLSAARALFKEAKLIYVHKLLSSEVFDQLPRDVPLLAAIHDHDAICVRSHRYTPLHSEPCYRRPGMACLRHGCVIVRRRDRRIGVGLDDPFTLLRRTRALAQRAVLVAGSAYLRNTLLDTGVPPSRVVVVHPVGPPPTEPLVDLPTEPVVGFVGQMIKGKGLDLLVRAVAGLPDVKLLVAGTGNQRPQIERLLRKTGLATRTTLLGNVHPSRVHEVYDQSRVVAVPSRWPEPFGMVGVEAMRRGRPVVAAWHGGIPEWLVHERTGLGFRPGSVDDLRASLRRALSSPLAERLAEAARERAERELLYETMIDEIEQVFRESGWGDESTF